MHKFLQIIGVATLSLFLFGCSSDSSSTDSITGTDSTHKEYHIVFRYVAAMDVPTKDIAQTTSIVKIDFEFKENNSVHYCVTMDKGPSCYDLIYAMDDSDGNLEYSMNRNNGKILMSFWPESKDTDGPVLIVMDYETKTMYWYVTSKKDLQKALETFNDALKKYE